MEGPRIVLLVVLLLFIFLTPDQPVVRRRPGLEIQRIVQERQRDFDVLSNSSYGDLSLPENRWLNLTGFRENDGYQWGMLPEAQDLSRAQLDDAWRGDSIPADAAIYRGITGELRGKFSRLNSTIDPARYINLTELDPRSEYLTAKHQRNITESDGELSISLIDTDGDDARDLQASLSIYAESAPGNGWQFALRGVHVVATGAAILTTSSRKFNALPALPQFALNPGDFELSRSLMNKTIRKLWKNAENRQDLALVESPDCELIAWLQHKPLDDGIGPRPYLQQVEDELQRPEGAPIGNAPPMAFSVTLFSPDCGYLLTADSLHGPKIEMYWTLARRLLLAFAIITCLQIIILKRQMETAATPSIRSRIAYHGIGIAALGDGLSLFGFIALLMLDEGAFLLIAAVTFLSCIHVAFLEVKFIFDIWTVQVGEPGQAEHDRQQRAHAPVTDRSVDVGALTGLPLPATAPRPPDGTTPVIIPFDQDLGIQTLPSSRTSFAAIYSRFYFTLVNLMFFSLWALSWPRWLRSIYANLLIFLYFSLWFPQIYRNIVRNCRKALNWEYVFGSSILRTVPLLYWYVVDRNILFVDTNRAAAAILLCWMWLQVLILLSQHFLGPRLFVKDIWCPPAYDYHPVLQEDVESGGLPISSLASASEAKDQDINSRRHFDCAVCMNEIDVPVKTREDLPGRGSIWLEQKNYMVTPCRHIFHSECLEEWMNLRLVCPVCREALPPL